MYLGNENGAKFTSLSYFS